MLGAVRRRRRQPPPPPPPPPLPPPPRASFRRRCARSAPLLLTFRPRTRFAQLVSGGISWAKENNLLKP
jgi:hypothetical protein